MKTSVLGINEVLFATVSLPSQVILVGLFSHLSYSLFMTSFFILIPFHSQSVWPRVYQSACMSVCLSVFGQSVFKSKLFFVKNLLELVLQLDLLEFLDIVMGLLTFFKAETEYVCTKSVLFFRKTLIGTTKWCGQMYFTTVRLL